MLRAFRDGRPRSFARLPVPETWLLVGLAVWTLHVSCFGSCSTWYSPDNLETGPIAAHGGPTEPLLAVHPVALCNRSGGVDVDPGDWVGLISLLGSCAGGVSKGCSTKTGPAGPRRSH